MIFVDGPDGVGKTGYSRWLSNELGLPRLEMRPVNDTDAIEHKSAVFNAAVRDLYDQGINLVVDRGSVSSIVYSRVFKRDHPGHAWDTLEHCEPTIVYLRCDVEELAVRYGNNDELYNDTEIAAIAQEYDNVMSDLNDQEGYGDVITIDTTSGALEVLRDVSADIAISD